MGWSTSVIARPDGNLTSYIASLERLRSIDVAVMYPAHGAPIYDAKGRVEELIAHRKMRAGQVVEALKAGNETVPAIVRQIYAGLDPASPGCSAIGPGPSGGSRSIREAGDQDSGANPLQSRYRLVD